MLEFAREQFLWLFALVALFFIVFLFARRWKKASVTYGFVWQRVAKQVRPPTWKRLLRIMLTLLLSTTMLGSAVLYAAGLGPEKAGLPAPLLLFILVDNSPSMRARLDLEGTSTRRSLAQIRAQEYVNALSEADRALIVRFEYGRAIAGRWLRRGEAIGSAPPTDLWRQDLSSLGALLSSVGAPPDVAGLPKPQPAIVWLGDNPPATEPLLSPPARLDGFAPIGRWSQLSGWPVLCETFGSAVANAAVVEAAYRSAAPGADFSGTLEGRLRDGSPACVEITSYSDSGAVALLAQDTPYRVPLSGRRRLDLAQKAWRRDSDVFSWDDRIEARIPTRGLTSIVIVRPPGEAPNPELREGLELLLPGRKIVETDGAIPESVDLAILDRVSTETSARLVLCFAAVPPSLGQVQPAREAKAGLFSTLASPDWLGFEVPNMQLLAGREVSALQPGHKLTALATHVEAGVLIAVSRGLQDVLFVGYSPTQSRFLFVPEGPTLLQRWLHAAQSRDRVVVPPFCRVDQGVEIKLDSPEKLLVKLEQGWGEVHGVTDYEIQPGPDGRAVLGPFEQAGRYVVSTASQSPGTGPGRELGRVFAYWVDETEQALPYVQLGPLDLSKLAPAKRDAGWVDWFPEVLLWIALCALTLEWFFWLLGITD